MSVWRAVGLVIGGALAEKARRFMVEEILSEEIDYRLGLIRANEAPMLEGMKGGSVTPGRRGRPPRQEAAGPVAAIRQVDEAQRARNLANLEKARVARAAKKQASVAD